MVESRAGEEFNRGQNMRKLEVKLKPNWGGHPEETSWWDSVKRQRPQGHRKESWSEEMRAATWAHQFLDVLSARLVLPPCGSQSWWPGSHWVPDSMLWGGLCGLLWLSETKQNNGRWHHERPMDCLGINFGVSSGEAVWGYGGSVLKKIHKGIQVLTSVHFLGDAGRSRHN